MLTHRAIRSHNREDNLSRLEGLFATLTVLPFDEMAARPCGHLKAELEEQGAPLDDLDLPLAANNAKHSKRIKELKIENWIQGAN